MTLSQRHKVLLLGAALLEAQSMVAAMGLSDKIEVVYESDETHLGLRAREAPAPEPLEFALSFVEELRERGIPMSKPVPQQIWNPKSRRRIPPRKFR